MTEYSLKYFKQHDGKDLWIAGMCAIGPFTTAAPNEALRFSSKQEAMQHPAFCHPTCLTDVVESP
jgi:hypothetical protein